VNVVKSCNVLEIYRPFLQTCYLRLNGEDWPNSLSGTWLNWYQTTRCYLSKR